MVGGVCDTNYAAGDVFALETNETEAFRVILNQGKKPKNVFQNNLNNTEQQVLPSPKTAHRGYNINMAQDIAKLQEEETKIRQYEDLKQYKSNDFVSYLPLPEPANRNIFC